MPHPTSHPPILVPAIAGMLLLAACGTGPVAPEPAVAALTSDTPEQMVAAIRATAGDGDGELAVQPLRDPMVDDLRELAERLHAQADHAAAAAALDQALEIVPGDPALLQERAEAAILLRDFEAAGTLAERAYALGAQVGPLCRRHWATLEQVRLVAGDADGAASARAQVEGCKVAGPQRF
jgi:tetratricopeptide (TPR) repeat protein